FRGASPAATIQQVLQDDPAPAGSFNPRVPYDLDLICLKCLAKDPVRRYPTARDLAEDLRRFLDARPLRARAPSWMGRLWQRVRSGWRGRPRRESPRQELERLREENRTLQAALQQRNENESALHRRLHLLQS